MYADMYTHLHLGTHRKTEYMKLTKKVACLLYDHCCYMFAVCVYFGVNANNDCVIAIDIFFFYCFSNLFS